MIGTLKDRVTISRETRTTDGMGGWTTEATTLATVWAHVKVPASKDGVIAGGDVEIRTHVVRVRQSTDTLGVQINDIVTWRGHALTVRACRPLGREWIDFDCKLEAPE